MSTINRVDQKPQDWPTQDLPTQERLTSGVAPWSGVAHDFLRATAKQIMKTLVQYKQRCRGSTVSWTAGLICVVPSV